MVHVSYTKKSFKRKFKEAKEIKQLDESPNTEKIAVSSEEHTKEKVKEAKTEKKASKVESKDLDIE